ncbi:MAG: molecular chaperone HtpG [Candidatus Margulisiibacteriota bacterium]
MAKEKTATEHFEFKTEVKQLLDLVIHSLYSHKDIFMRELISNAADAIDRLRFEALTQPNLLDNKDPWQIKLIADKEAKTLTISDNGIGMNHDELVDHLGTIAKSGTKAFMEQIKKSGDNVNLIGQFGVGFYSAFMVADTVSVISRKAGEPLSHRWTSTGEGSFEIMPDKKESRGTDIVLHLKDEEQNYLNEYTLRQIIKKYSDFVEHAIVMDIEREETPKDSEGKDIKDAKPLKTIKQETLNSQKALWTKAKSEIKEDEYAAFYKHISNDFQKPLRVIHYSAEGNIEFKALLFIPEKAPFDLFYPDAVKGIHLYVKRIFIMDDCKKIIPEYLRFVKGVVDSNDLPLNVSRELLQQDTQLDKIKKNVVGKVLSELSKMMEKDYPEYLKFYKEFGKVLKEGVHYDYENKEKLVDLCLYETSTTTQGELSSFKQYVDRMSDDQKDIYYLSAESYAVALSSPHLEMFRQKGIEVLFMCDPIDEWFLNSVSEYKGKKLKAIDKGDIELGDEKKKEDIAEKQKEYKGLLGIMLTAVSDDVKEIRFSTRLTDSASCLVADEFGLSKQMEQMFKSMGQEAPAQKKILEINPDHTVVFRLKTLFETDPAAPEIKDYTQLLYNQALITEGSKPKDPVAFAKKVSDLMIKALK